MTALFTSSVRQHERARRHLAAGISTLVRATQRPVPICFTHARGARMWDVDGNEYVDYALSYGPMLLGHSPESVLDAVRDQLGRGLGFGAASEYEAELAELLCRVVPSAEMCILSTTGSEAVHAALRLARAATGRPRVVKFLGHYDGWYDSIHVGVPGQSGPYLGTAGQDPAAVEAVTVCPWNDVEALAAVLDAGVAAVIMEPLAVNGGCIHPADGYLEAVRDLTRRNGTLLVFDEVITGFRVALGGAQELYGVVPDLTVLGKALGGGFPISAVCGRADVFDEISSQRMAHIGTFNGNPVCTRAAIAAIGEYERERATMYPRLAEKTRRLIEAFHSAGQESGLPLQVAGSTGVAHAFLAPAPVTTYEQTLAVDAAGYRDFAAHLLTVGVHVTPRGLLYVSTAHTDEDLEITTKALLRAASAAVAGPPPGSRG